jgi:glutathione peroxidase
MTKRNAMCRGGVGLLLAVAMLSGSGSFVRAADDSDEKKPSSQPSVPALRYKLKTVEGKEYDLMNLHGRVIILMPVAWDSNRKMLEDFQRVNARFKELGIVVIGVLTDSFGEEKRTDAEVVAAMRDRYDVTFPIYARVSTKGEKIHPLFKYLTSKDVGHEFGGELKGTFTRFLINRDGEVIARAEPKTPIGERSFWRKLQEAAESGMKD